MPQQIWKTFFWYILYELLESNNNYAGQPSMQVTLTIIIINWHMQKSQMRVPFNFFAHSPLIRVST